MSGRDTVKYRYDQGWAVLNEELRDRLRKKLAHTYTYDQFGRLTKKTDGTYTADYYYHYGDKLTKAVSKGRSAAVGRRVGCLLATAPLGLCLPGCPQGGCMSRWAKGERRCLRMVGVAKPTATGTGTRVGVVRIKAEWQGWCDAVLEYLRCTGAIPSHREPQDRLRVKVGPHLHLRRGPEAPFPCREWRRHDSVPLRPGLERDE